MAHPTEDRNFRLPTHVRPAAYDAALSVDLDGRAFSGTMRLVLVLAQATDELVLHAAGLEVSRARADAGRAPVEPVEMTTSERRALRWPIPIRQLHSRQLLLCSLDVSYRQRFPTHQQLLHSDQ
jgi:puromycin-sensitive aminopeptidase